jgi:hypothetical protein
MRLRAWLLDRGGLLAICVLALYVWLAPTTFVDGDNAEFSALSVLGGAAHPPGYPLYVLWLRALSWLPGASPAHTAAIATALLGAGAILMLHAACRAWGARPLAATCACALFAVSPVVMTMHTEAEVFALNDLLVAAVLWLAADRGPLRGGARAAALGLVAGLALSNQLTCVLIAPLGLYGIGRAFVEARWKALALAVAGVVVGMTPYLYLLAAPATQASWGSASGLGDVIDMFLRRDYGGPTSFYASGHAAPGAHLVALLGTLGRAWLWLPLAIGVATLAVRATRVREGERRLPWILLAIAIIAAGPVLALRFNTEADGLGLYVVERFHILPALLFAIPIAVGLGELAARAPAEIAKLSRAGSVIAPTLGLVAVAALSLGHVQSAHAPTYERYSRNVLDTLPQRAVVLTQEDEIYFGGAYLQRVMDRRPDVTIVNWALLVLPWYRRRVEPWGIVPDHSRGTVTVRLARKILADGRPLLVDRELARFLPGFPSYPLGTLVRFLPEGTPPPTLDEIAHENRDVYERFELTGERPDAPWPRELHHMYAETWRIIGDGYAAAGHPQEAAAALDIARQVGPQP